MRPSEIFFVSGIDLEDAHLDLLADGEHVFRLVDAAPRDVADVQQAVDAADIDKCAVGHEAAHRSGERVAGLHARRGGLRAAARACSSSTTRRSTTTSSSVTSSLVMRQVICWPTSSSISAASRVPLRLAGMKARTPTSTREAALDDAGHGAGDGELLRECCFERRPVARLRHAKRESS